MQWLSLTNATVESVFPVPVPRHVVVKTMTEKQRITQIKRLRYQIWEPMV